MLVQSALNELHSFPSANQSRSHEILHAVVASPPPLRGFALQPHLPLRRFRIVPSGSSHGSGRGRSLSDYALDHLGFGARALHAVVEVSDGGFGVGGAECWGIG